MPRFMVKLTGTYSRIVTVEARDQRHACEVALDGGFNSVRKPELNPPTKAKPYSKGPI